VTRPISKVLPTRYRLLSAVWSLGCSEGEAGNVGGKAKGKVLPVFNYALKAYGSFGSFTPEERAPVANWIGGWAAPEQVCTIWRSEYF
jgi:hypothetical protein